jgi:hypothetical protein
MFWHPQWYCPLPAAEETISLPEAEAQAAPETPFPQHL